MNMRSLSKKKKSFMHSRLIYTLYCEGKKNRFALYLIYVPAITKMQ